MTRAINCTTDNCDGGTCRGCKGKVFSGTVLSILMFLAIGTGLLLVVVPGGGAIGYASAYIAATLLLLAGIGTLAAAAWTISRERLYRQRKLLTREVSIAFAAAIPVGVIMLFGVWPGQPVGNVVALACQAVLALAGLAVAFSLLRALSPDRLRQQTEWLRCCAFRNRSVAISH